MRVISVFLLVYSACSLFAQASSTPDAVFRDFVPLSSLQAVGDGKKLDGEFFFSTTAKGSLLFVSDPLNFYLIISPREKKVFEVSKNDLIKEGDVYHIKAETVLKESGMVVENGDSLLIDLGDRKFFIKEKDPLLGFFSTDELLKKNKEYKYKASLYKFSTTLVEELKKFNKNVEVLVFFGSWCPFCARMMPKILRVAKELEGSRINFKFYGLPKNISGDAIAKKYGVTGVPTGLVIVEGDIIGRIQGRDWRIPELAIKKYLGI